MILNQYTFCALLFLLVLEETLLWLEPREEIFHLPFSQPPPVIKAVVVGRMSQISHTGPPLLFSLSTEHLLAEWVLIKWSHDGRRWRLGESVTAVELGFVKSFRSKPLQVIILAIEEKLCTEPRWIWNKNSVQYTLRHKYSAKKLQLSPACNNRQQENTTSAAVGLISKADISRLNFLSSLSLFAK